MGSHCRHDVAVSLPHFENRIFSDLNFA
jgi:hypothetical protein